MQQGVHGPYRSTENNSKQKALDRLKSMEYKCLDNFEEYIYIFKDF